MKKAYILTVTAGAAALAAVLLVKRRRVKCSEK